jgi:hypothetical protein
VVLQPWLSSLRHDAGSSLHVDHYTVQQSDIDKTKSKEFCLLGLYSLRFFLFGAAKSKIALSSDK